MQDFQKKASRLLISPQEQKTIFVITVQCRATVQPSFSLLCICNFSMVGCVQVTLDSIQAEHLVKSLARETVLYLVGSGGGGDRLAGKDPVSTVR